MADMTRRQFLKVTGVTLAGSSLALIGFSPTPALAEVRTFKLARATRSQAGLSAAKPAAATGIRPG